MKLKNLLGQEGMELILANLEEEDQENTSIDPMERIVEKAISKGLPVKKESDEFGKMHYSFTWGDFSGEQRREARSYAKALIAYLGILRLKMDKPEVYKDFKEGLLVDRGEVEVNFIEIGKKIPEVGLAYGIYKLYSFYKKMSGKSILS